MVSDSSFNMLSEIHHASISSVLKCFACARLITTCFNVVVNVAPGSLCFVATILACTCGLWNSKKNCALYWAYEDMCGVVEMGVS